MYWVSLLKKYLAHNTGVLGHTLIGTDYKVRSESPGLFPGAPIRKAFLSIVCWNLNRIVCLHPCCVNSVTAVRHVPVNFISVTLFDRSAWAVMWRNGLYIQLNEMRLKHKCTSWKMDILRVVKFSISLCPRNRSFSSAAFTMSRCRPQVAG